MTSHKIGVNLRVSVSCDQGGRRYMEDTHSSQFIKCGGKEYEFAYFGIFDGHGGAEASKFARENLLDEITKYDCFWSDDDEDVMYAIKYGFLDTHYAMWKELERWPKTVKGLPNTSGTTASIAIIKNSKIYIGHVGDSGIVLGCNEANQSSNYPAIHASAKCLTKDHKPESPEEKSRIEESGGAVMCKSGVQRVVWRRPTLNHKGPIRRSTHIDEIPFLAVARSLGDLWSYDYYNEKFVVSPEPDVSVHRLDANKHKCLIFASDGLWNMVSPEESVTLVMNLERHFEERIIHDLSASLSYWINPAERLVTRALNKWQSRLMKADNTSAIVVYIDPLGPSKLTLLKKKREEACMKKQIGASILMSSTSLPVGCSSGLKIDTNGDKPAIPVISTMQTDCDKLKQSTAVDAPSKLTDVQSSNVKDIPSEHSKALTRSQLDNSVQAGSAPSQGLSPLVSSSSFTSSTASLQDVVGFSKFNALKLDVKSEENGFSTKDGNSTSNQKSQNNLCSGILQTTRDNAHVNNKKNQSARKGISDNFGHIFKSTKPFLSLEKVLNLKCGVFHKKNKNVHCKKDSVVMSQGGKDTNNSSLYKTNGHHLRSDMSSGYAKKTCKTLHRVKGAARRAMSLENSVFVRRRNNSRLTRLKRKSADDVLNGPVSKRLRKCDG
ncbi:uncharacterized protein LOC121367884 [Gigantopelta aegis]|uniref:uncharacterized protein LOC121367884 n=1 Tax=Gigantopelta aegis TaxID=1735272 RepID=UPI001B88867A|nr:uncharacterized protein LOC121367884 [Gigantopelta aegis]